MKSFFAAPLFYFIMDKDESTINGGYNSQTGNQISREFRLENPTSASDCDSTEPKHGISNV